MTSTNQIKIVIIGFGNMGRDWVPVLKKDKSVTIIGVVDVIDRNLEDAKQLLNLDNSSVGNDLEAVLREKKPDAILNTTPPVFHAEMVKLALRHNCHILGEKPISLSLAEAESIVRLCNKRKRIYMINQNYRWNPTVQKIKSTLSSGKIGTIHSVSIIYAQNFKFVDTFRYKIDHPFLLDMAVHHFDLVRYLTKSQPKSVYCIEYNISTSPFKNGSSATAIFHMKPEVVFSYHGSWGDVGNGTSFMGLWKISGDKGSITWDGDSFPHLEYMKDKKVKIYHLKPARNFDSNTKEAFEYELASTLSRFISAIKSGNQPETWCGDNIFSLKMVLGSLSSAQKGKLVLI